ncbi:MAG: class I SAM-dependent methyltransferase [Phycisphaerae bacterium]|nr:class I SAM-dependent methyltransferase [Phycisphaerae bacterium]
MNQDNLNQEWVDLAPAWIKEARQGENPNREGLLDNPMLEACGNVEGLRVLDCGCGEGRFCRLLTNQGAEYVLGVDLCKPMIDAAEEMQSGGDEYRIADVQNMNYLESQTFDLAVSYLNQCDLPDFNANNKEVFRVLKPGGKFIIANLHPMRSATGGWHRSDEGEKLHAMLDRYFEENERRWMMMGVEFTNFHRSLATYVRGFLKAGFCLDDIIEPTATQEQLKRYPQLEDELRVPNFIVYVLKKP